MADREANVANAFETTLTASMGATDTTATVASTSGGPSSPCYLVIDPDDGSKREIIFFDGTFTGTTFVTSSTANRHLSGSAATSGLTHASGAKVVSVPVAQLWADINDRVEGHDHSGSTDGTSVAASDLSGHDKAAHDALNIDADSLDGLQGTAYYLADGTRALNGPLNHDGTTAGFYGVTPVTRQLVQGARDDPEDALRRLLIALEAVGIIDDQTQATGP